jgi:hypothetical protein
LDSARSVQRRNCAYAAAQKGNNQIRSGASNIKYSINQPTNNMKFLLLLAFAFICSFCNAQDTVFFKIEPNRGHLVDMIIRQGNNYVMRLVGSSTESKIAVDDVLRIGTQQPTTKTVIPIKSYNDTLRTEEYCIIVGTTQMFSTKVKITVDFGEERSFWGGRDYITDETGNVVKFNSMVDALNYMNSIGWQFVSAYPMVSNQGTCYHYLMKRNIK